MTIKQQIEQHKKADKKTAEELRAYADDMESKAKRAREAAKILSQK